jgi:hypothetical protein
MTIKNIFNINIKLLINWSYNFFIGPCQLFFILYQTLIKVTHKTTWFHLSKWKSIAFPKELGGWGIKNIYWFAKSLAAKSCWRGIAGNCFWIQILKGKYWKSVDLIPWTRKGIFKYPTTSNCWKNFMNSIHFIN